MSATAARLPLPQLPWREVNECDALDVAAVLNLPATGREGGRKMPCVWCDSSDALHAYPSGRAHCFSCGCNASNVDLAAHVLGLEPAAAVRELARRLGIHVGSAPNPGPGAARAPRLAPPISASRPRLAAETDVFAALREDGSCTARPMLYAAVLAALRLTEPGAAYLGGRGFDPAHAEAFGFRSIDDADAWGTLWAYLADRFTPGECREAGFPDAPALAKAPWQGDAPALVIPYRFAGAIVGIRFRRMGPGGPRYQTLPSAPRPAPSASPPLPFNADAIDAARGAELHVVEGELNAYALAYHGEHAVGLPGALPGAAWLARWLPRTEPVASLIAWYDTDGAGERGRTELTKALAAAHGGQWVRERGREAPSLPMSKDLSDWQRAGRLGALVASKRWRA